MWDEREGRREQQMICFGVLACFGLVFNPIWFLLLTSRIQFRERYRNMLFGNSSELSWRKDLVTLLEKCIYLEIGLKKKENVFEIQNSKRFFKNIILLHLKNLYIKICIKIDCLKYDLGSCPKYFFFFSNKCNHILSSC